MLPNLRLARCPWIGNPLERTRLRGDVPHHSILSKTNHLPAILTSMRSYGAPHRPDGVSHQPVEARPLGARPPDGIPPSSNDLRAEVGISVPSVAHIRSPSCLGNTGTFRSRFSGHTCTLARQSKVMAPTLAKVELCLDDICHALHPHTHTLKLTAPCGLPGRPPTPLVTGPCAA